MALKQSEFRRKYMQKLVRSLRADGHSVKTSKAIAEGLILLMQKWISQGREIDFGFMKLKPSKTTPITIKGRDTVHLVGAKPKWKVHIRQSWLNQ